MSSSDSAPRRRARVLGIATAIMCALAGGALWCLLSLYSRSNLAWLAFIVAAVIAWVLRANGHAGARGALPAAILVVLASLYAFYLQAIASVASTVGVPMREALLRVDFGMAVDVARRSLDGWSIATVVAAAVLAAALVSRGGRHRGA